MERNGKIWEGEHIPVGTIIGYQIQWQTPAPAWETVSELEYYRALHQTSALCHGRLILAAYDEEVLTNSDGVIKPLARGG